jgi:hypothetical protein
LGFDLIFPAHGVAVSNSKSIVVPDARQIPSFASGCAALISKMRRDRTTTNDEGIMAALADVWMAMAAAANVTPRTAG